VGDVLGAGVKVGFGEVVVGESVGYGDADTEIELAVAPLAVVIVK
jgi:hypothetical protein